MQKRFVALVLALALGLGTALSAAAQAPVVETGTVSWSGVFDGEVDFPVPSDQLDAVVAARQAEGHFEQALARGVMEKINELRSVPNVWYWTPGEPDTKTELNNGVVTLAPLRYNINLEAVAQRRAVEMSLHVDSSERPDGSKFDALCAQMSFVEDVRSSSVRAYNANKSLEECYVEWIAEDGSYSDQGMRRLWLDPFALTVGIACFNCNGANFWCFVFGRNGDARGTLDENGELSGVERFVTRLYSLCLGREADLPGLNDWVAKLKNGAKTGSECAYGFYFSQEFTGRNYSSAEYVTLLYRAMMGREPDAAGLQDWVGRLAAGTPREVVFNGFVGSQEFTNLCTSYGIVRGDGDGISAFVDRLYRVCFDRGPDVAGFNDWTARLRTQTATGTEVAHGFAMSKEMANLGLNDEQYVEAMYLAFFDREYDDAGKADWLNRMHVQGYDREQVFYGFAGSQEFDNLCARYGILRA